jgi:hypothetical protein
MPHRFSVVAANKGLEHQPALGRDVTVVTMAEAWKTHKDKAAA